MDSRKNHRRPQARPGIRRASRGFTIVELIISMSILLVAASIFYRMVASTSQLREVNRQNAIAADAARVVLEEMRNEDFTQLFYLFNEDPSDDPDGPGTAPGNRFFVEDLVPLPTRPDGLVGEVILPARITKVEQEPSGEAGGKMAMGGAGAGGRALVDELWLREDIPDAELGLPRDLNGDNVVDDSNHAGDYMVLPVSIVVRWQGKYSERSLRVVTMLTDFDPAQ